MEPSSEACYVILMDTVIDIRAPEIDWSPVAQTMLVQMPDADQALIQQAVDQTYRHFDPHRLTLIEPTRDGDKPFYVLPVAGRLLAFIERAADDRIRVLDVLRAEQLDVLRDRPNREIGSQTSTAAQR
jgi:hypothetical protein